MFEKCNPSHPDKVADRIAGAIVDLTYVKNPNPKVACEVLIGHGKCHIICETSEKLDVEDIKKLVYRIARTSDIDIDYQEVPQDIHLANNQKEEIRCGDNGIFKGTPTSMEEIALSKFARKLYERVPYDGKYIIVGMNLIICQSNINGEKIKELYPDAIVNPLGDWTGGLNVDAGCTNRKLGSDMGRCVTGGGLHGKDLSKADVSINIYAYLKAQETGKDVELYCAIGDKYIDGKPYNEIVEIARNYIRNIGGFEKFAEWGLI